jgi:major membrane immunogen (membrane-anchored lipoprotein)
MGGVLIMKKNIGLLLSGLILFLFIATGLSYMNSAKAGSYNKRAGSVSYKDGTYTVKTSMDAEGFYSKATLVIKKGKIQRVTWNIIDNNNKVFDKNYEAVYTGNQVYIQQCRDEIKGIKIYGPKLIKVQAVEKVDAISKATWSYNKFKEVVSLALAKAKK